MSPTPPSLTADKLSLYFKTKVEKIRAATADADTPTYSSSNGNMFTGFTEYTMEEVRCVLARSPPKTCMLDPIPTDVLLPIITITCNSSLREGSLPVSQKAAIITPVLKRAGLEADDDKSYQPISNLTFISKVIERMVAAQIKAFLDESDLMPPMQSAYRAGTR